MRQDILRAEDIFRLNLVTLKGKTIKMSNKNYIDKNLEI